ncbi:MAG: hypothetical protein DCC51_12260, partial [Anaerolineae bacterium]
MDLWHEFHGPNAGYVLELYDRFRANPNSVDPATRAAFERWQPPAEGQPAVPSGEIIVPEADKVMATVNLATTIREYGHLAAHIDPLG